MGLEQSHQKTHAYLFKNFISHMNLYCKNNLNIKSGSTKHNRTETLLFFLEALVTILTLPDLISSLITASFRAGDASLAGIQPVCCLPSFSLQQVGSSLFPCTWLSCFSLGRLGMSVDSVLSAV